MKTDLNRLQRNVGSLAMRIVFSDGRIALTRGLREAKRRISGERHVVEYFHQVDDPYSHLAAQMLSPLVRDYDVDVISHLVPPASLANASEPRLLSAFARKDARDIAPAYGLEFPESDAEPGRDAVELAQRILAGTDAAEFGPRAGILGEALWGDHKDRLEQLELEWGARSLETARARLEEGDARRAKLRHYSGGMFYYAGEWYWGVDRLHHLEARLRALGTARDASADLLAPPPAIDAGRGRDSGRLVLEFYPSLRSPYTAIIYDRAISLAEQLDVRVVLKPVMPMVMRGVPAPAAKGFYIFGDTRREAKVAGVAFGALVDPIGRPVERGFSLFPWAREQGRGAEFLGSFLRAAWAEGVDTSGERGLRRVVERAGLEWDEARAVMGNEAWRDELEENRKTLYGELGLWGVPSFRVRGPDGEPDFATWGQDRLWLVARELRRRISL